MKKDKANKIFLKLYYHWKKQKVNQKRINTNQKCKSKTNIHQMKGNKWIDKTSQNTVYY